MILLHSAFLLCATSAQGRTAFCFLLSAFCFLTCPFGQFQTAQFRFVSLLPHHVAGNNMESTLLPPTRSKFYSWNPDQGGYYVV